MKKIFTLIAMAIFSSAVVAQAQPSFSAGVTNSRWQGQAIGNLNDLAGLSKETVQLTPLTGVFAGGAIELPLSDILSLQSGLYYSQKGFRMEGNVPTGKFDFLNAGATATARAHYIDIPITLRAEVAEGLQLFAGPQVSYLAKTNLRVDAGLLGVSLFRKNIDITDAFNRVDLGLTGGAAYHFGNGLFATAAYDHGLMPLDKNNRTEAYNRGFRVGIGFRF